MKVPEYPENEDVRIEILRSLNILDTEPEERFDRITRIAKRLFGVPIVLISLVDLKCQWFKSSQGIEPSQMPQSRDVSFCGHAIVGDEIFIVADALLDDRFYDNPYVIDEPKIRFYAGVPLIISKGIKLGTLCLIDRCPRILNEEDRRLLQDLGQMAVQELAVLQLATIDELTQISNRRGFVALSQYSLKLCKRENKPASLFFLDLDLFKEINDRYGHAEGDRALIDFSMILKESFRESDVVGRLGGDEFVALLSNVDREETQLVLERLERSLEEFNQKSNRGYQIICSVGIVAFDSSRHQSINDLLAEGDRLMYAQKQEKRKKSVYSPS
ncbi:MULTISPECIES: sensor domain-containing diguanylate cyclase [Pseudanabaena]|uniref:Diguanylate cyclase with GAF sensor n=2 Tax=Pseudanabaena TaxID=1152 RepID=L8N9B5_9CYAN|nr:MULTISPECIES: sensor domain-containing diguanylate cyclase [Pseudanabaena]ELS34803.1 diguanylate cyclase with GAF sensor [Pseudanabaena biceps PCC 7429]MDG3493039.1 sensor domain-containing diguanylate cyclase [Pseudanabaena catenata USMAC16]